jgi:hypothetical protein
MQKPGVKPGFFIEKARKSWDFAHPRPAFAWLWTVRMSTLRPLPAEPSFPAFQTKGIF